MQGLVVGPCRQRELQAQSGAQAGMIVAPRGFTLLDVLVSIAVVVILISIMLPSLGRVRETAHQVICRSNVRQMGIGIALYAEDNRHHLMRTVHLDENNPWDTTALRLAPQPGANGPGNWDGLGLLYSLDYLPAPKLYYCPSHHGRNAFRDYEDQWGARSFASIYGNYQFRGRGPMAGYHPLHTAPNTFFLPDINPSSAILADSMRSQSDFNHRIGANVLRANLSVEWYSDNSGRLVTMLPREGEPPHSMFEDVWRNLDDEEDR